MNFRIGGVAGDLGSQLPSTLHVVDGEGRVRDPFGDVDASPSDANESSEAKDKEKGDDPTPTDTEADDERERERRNQVIRERFGEDFEGFGLGPGARRGPIYTMPVVKPKLL